MKFRKKIGYLTKLNPFDHQYDHFLNHRDELFWAFLWDMGTGKTKIVIDICVYLHLKNLIDCVIFVAPNQVHLQHIKKAIPEHIYSKIAYNSFGYESKTLKNKGVQSNLKRVLLSENKLSFFSFNTDSLRMDKGYNLIKEILTTRKCAMIVDEYTDFKNPKSKRSKRLLSLANYPKYKFILDGTPIHKGPMDVWVGFNFLHMGCLGFSSATAYRNRYCKLKNWKLKKDIYKILKWSKYYKKYDVGGERVLPDNEYLDLSELTETIYHAAKNYKVKKGFLQRNLPAKLHDIAPLLISTCADTYFQTVGHKNLDELQGRIKRFSSRYLLTDCVDMPEKTFLQLPYELDKKTRDIYSKLKKDYFVEFNKGTMTVENQLTELLRMRQLIGGHLQLDDTKGVTEISTQRVELLLWQLKKLPDTAKVVIFCRFTPEILQIMRFVRSEYGQESIVDFYGDTPMKQRGINKDAFIYDSKCRFIVCNRRTGGVGVDGLQVGTHVIHYSKNFSSRLHNQSTARVYRSGLKHSLVVIDLFAKNTVDQKINQILSQNKSVSDEITGDNSLDLFSEG